jgi:tetratricopeptide (TPR) repeat protein
MLGGLSIEHAAELSPSAATFSAGDTLPVAGAAAQRRPLALLAFLATAPEGGRSRDQVLLHLWPDSTPTRARNVLKQTLYSLRRDLGAPDIVLQDGDRIRLNPALLTSDVAELEAALDRGEVERALALHRGPFLDGFSLGDVPEFERWAQRERERLTARVDAARRPIIADGPPQRVTTAHSPPARRRRASPRRLARLGLVALITATGFVAVDAGYVHLTTSTGVAVDSSVIAVAPFDVASADSSLAFLATGMVDLLSLRFAGDGQGGLRAVAPRLALGTWAHDSSELWAAPMTKRYVRLGEKLGAGRVLRGSVVGTSAHLVLTADMLAASSGTVVARASVAGVADSLSVLVDRLAGMLLLRADAVDADAESDGGTVRATTPLVAVRDYVEGQVAYRAGHYDEAVRHFDAALARDSTFAPAALGLAKSAGWAGAPVASIQRGSRLAWKYEDRLSQRARLLLVASVGGDSALRTGYATGTEIIYAAERAAEATPDDAEAWYWLADRYLHLGPTIGVTAALERAAAAFRRSVSLDPTFAPPFVHLVQLAARAGDTNAVLRFGSQLLKRDSTSESAQLIRWRMAVMVGDSAALRALRSHFDEMPLGTLRLILTTAESDAVGLDDADRALSAMLRRSATADERAIALVYAHAYAIDRGRWADALRATESLGDADPAPRWHLRIRVLDALYAGGDSAAARAAVDSLRPFADAPLSSNARARSAQYEDMSVVIQWQLWHGNRRGLARALERLTLSASPRDSLRRVVANRISAALLRAIATNTGGSRDPATVETLDALLAANVMAPYEWPGLYPALVAAQLFAANGLADRGLTAVRRRAQYFPESAYLAPSLALEARFAAQLGDTASSAAIRRELSALWGSPRADIIARALGH